MLSRLCPHAGPTVRLDFEHGDQITNRLPRTGRAKKTLAFSVFAPRVPWSHFKTSWRKCLQRMPQPQTAFVDGLGLEELARQTCRGAGCFRLSHIHMVSLEAFQGHCRGQLIDCTSSSTIIRVVTVQLDTMLQLTEETLPLHEKQQHDCKLCVLMKWSFT